MTTQSSQGSSNRSVWLVRHAKSARPFGVEDLERPLNRRGRRDGAVMAVQLAKEEHSPELFLTSHSLRTRQTTELVSADLDAQIEVVPELYMGRAEDVEDLVRGVDPSIASVAIVSHLPTIERCLWACKTRGRIELFPTLAMARLEHGSSWADFQFATATVHEFMIPRSFRN